MDAHEKPCQVRWRIKCEQCKAFYSEQMKRKMSSIRAKFASIRFPNANKGSIDSAGDSLNRNNDKCIQWFLIKYRTWSNDLILVNHNRPMRFTSLLELSLHSSLKKSEIFHFWLEMNGVKVDRCLKQRTFSLSTNKSKYIQCIYRVHTQSSNCKPT